jgi:hypothetical protein
MTFLVMNVKRMVKLLEIKAQKGGILQTGQRKGRKGGENIEKEQEPIPKTA